MKRFFLTGLLVWVPLGITLWVLRVIVSTLDGTLAWLPPTISLAMSPYVVPGTGVIVTVVVVFVTGVFTSNFMGQKVVRFWEKLLSQIPVVKTIYASVKQVSDTMLSDSSQAFSKALLIEYPRHGIWTIAFLTGDPAQATCPHIPPECVSIYVPTTPNPTSGFFLLIPKREVIELDMSVDDALKYIISMGLAHPEHPIAPNSTSSAMLPPLNDKRLN